MPPKGRTNVKGQPQQPRQHKRRKETVNFKLNVLFLVREHGMAAAVRIAFPSIAQAKLKNKTRQVQRWQADAEKLLDAAANGRGHHAKLRDPDAGRVLTDEAEEQVEAWLADMRRDGVPVSYLLLEYKAKEVARASGVAAGSFAASWSLQQRFLQQYGYSLRRKTRIGQVPPPDADAVTSRFHQTVLDAIEKHSIVEVYNADQTAITYEFLPTRTLNKKGARTVWVRSSGAKKKRVTVMLLADSRGKKRVPFVVFKQAPARAVVTQAFNREHQNGFGKVVWREIATLVRQHGFQIFGNSTAWWNSDLSVEFLKCHFSERDNLDENVLLLWDDFSAHWTAEVQAYAASINVVLLRIPPGYTFCCQPADISWIKPLKLSLRLQWVNDLQCQLRAHQASGREGASKLSAPSRSTLMAWLSAAWDGLAESTVASGFNRLNIPSDRREVTTDELAALDCTVEKVVASLRALDIAAYVGDASDAEEDERDGGDVQ